MSGLATGVDDNANLIVQLPDGTERHLSSGEASLCRVKK
jgi:BirA family biotin operon repressor/biotin-[acetyl-CoA-carboxylase] ligase